MSDDKDKKPKEKEENIKDLAKILIANLSALKKTENIQRLPRRGLVNDQKEK